MAYVNPFRYSTRLQDDISDLVYYGYRHYNPYTGKWLSRDPIEEWGGINLYAHVVNNPISKADCLGLSTDFYCCKLRDALKYAKLAKAAYGGPPPSGWEKLDPAAAFQIPNLLFENKDSGYSSTLFYDPTTKQYVIAFAGTDDLHDWTQANIPQNYGFRSYQYKNATRLAGIPGRDILGVTFVCHSLCGGLA